MRPSKSKYSSKWYQQPVSELLALALNQGLQLGLAAFTALAMAGVKVLKKPVALVLTGSIPLLVIACHHLAMVGVAARQPPHLKEIMGELSAIRIPTGKVVPNHANTKLLYIKSTAKDTWALYWLDLASQKSSVLHEILSGHGASEMLAKQSMTILGWSPHDEYFAYAMNDWKEIVICHGNSGAELARGPIAVANPAGKNTKKAKPVVSRPVATSTWLSSRSLLCSDGNQIVEFSQSPNGWDRTLFYKTSRAATGTDVQARTDAPPVPQTSVKTNSLATPLALPAGEIKSLAALDLDSAVWQQANAIYVGERAGALQLVWKATNCTLIKFSFSAKAGKFLLHCKDNEGQFLAEYCPRLWSGDGTLTNVVRLDTSEYNPDEAQFINNGAGYAYRNQSDFSSSKLVIKVTRTSPPVELPWPGEVRGFFINDLQLYGITASVTEPPGIWKCDLVSGAADCLVPSIEHPFKYAAHAPVLEGYITNAAGERLTYYLLQPVKSPGIQKYPLVVGNMGIGELGNTWDRLAQTVANCGGYFVSMDRRKRKMDQWADDALCAYQFLSKNFAVDTNNVYLLGISAGAYTANSLLESKPDIWKGAILLSTRSFPTLEPSRLQAIALDVGAADINKVRLLQSQDQLAASGIRPILMLHPGVGHLIRGIRLDRTRMEQIAAFIHQP